jgi:hypothetical protein
MYLSSDGARFFLLAMGSSSIYTVELLLLNSVLKLLVRVRRQTPVTQRQQLLILGRWAHTAAVVRLHAHENGISCFQSVVHFLDVVK